MRHHCVQESLALIKNKKMNIKHIVIIVALFMSHTSHSQISSNNYTIGTSLLIQSEIMEDEREVQIYLPESYAESDRKYPVLYVLDGQRYFLHAVSLQKAFTEFKETPEFIIIGISKNKPDRNRNFSVNSKKYLEFIKTEVIDYIEQKFRTSEKRFLFGWAYGGGFTVETMIREPDLFDGYIAASPFPLTGKIDKIDSLLNNYPSLEKILYFTSGTNEGLVKEETNKLNKYLSGKTIEKFDWTFRELKEEEHRSTPYVTLYHGLKKCFEYYPELQFNNLDAFIEAGGLEFVRSYYEERSKRYGFPKDLSDWTMFSLTRNAIRAEKYNEFDVLMREFKRTGFLKRLRISRSTLIGDFYFQNKQYEEAIDLFEALVKEHPDSKRPLEKLSEIYTEMGKEKEALRYLEKANSLTKKDSN